MSDVETVERVIAAPPEKIFAILANPQRHQEIDGSGTLRGQKSLPDHLEQGATFSMEMHMGVGYRMINTVVEYEQDRKIAWQPRPDNALMRIAVGGRIWRYELEPTPGGTRVRESWDISQEKIKPMVAPMRSKTREGMIATLERLDKAVTE